MTKVQISEEETHNITWTRHPPPNSLQLQKEKENMGPLSRLKDHDCLVYILQFLAWQDLNTFALASLAASASAAIAL